MGDTTWKTCGESIKKSLKRFFDKTLENFASMKLYVIGAACFMLWKDKLTADWWFYTVTATISARGLIEVATVVKDMKLGVSGKPATKKGKSDADA